MDGDATVVGHVVDDRVPLLGLDEFYRRAMQRHERSDLLPCARAISSAVGVEPANVPIEGYYAEDELLREYFRLMRALQGVDARLSTRCSTTGCPRPTSPRDRAARRCASRRR